MLAVWLLPPVGRYGYLMGNSRFAYGYFIMCLGCTVVLLAILVTPRAVAPRQKAGFELVMK